MSIYKFSKLVWPRKPFEDGKKNKVRFPDGLKTPKIISIKNKYYLFEITNIDKYEKTLKDKDVYDMISSQIAIKKKFENAKKLNEMGV